MVCIIFLLKKIKLTIKAEGKPFSVDTYCEINFHIKEMEEIK